MGRIWRVGDGEEESRAKTRRGGAISGERQAEAGSGRQRRENIGCTARTLLTSAGVDHAGQSPRAVGPGGESWGARQREDGHGPAQNALLTRLHPPAIKNGPCPPLFSVTSPRPALLSPPHPAHTHVSYRPPHTACSRPPRRKGPPSRGPHPLAPTPGPSSGRRNGHRPLRQRL